MFERTRVRGAHIALLLMMAAALGMAGIATSEASGTRPVAQLATPVEQQTFPPIASAFTPAVTSTGVTLTSYSGGTVNDLQFELQLQFNGGARAYATEGGEFVALIPDAPPFVNAPFLDFFAGFPEGIPAGTPLLIVVDEYPAEFQTDLDAARAAWATAGGDDYDMQMSVSCFCLISPDVVGLPIVDIEVRNGVITSAVTVDGVILDPVPGLFKTVEGVFDEIQDAIDGRAARIDATYHADGYPQSVFIDRAFLIADEEIGYTIHSLTLR